MAHPHHIVLSGSGTTGYLHPGLAIAQRVIEQMPGAQVTFVGSGRMAERHAVRAAGFQYVNIPSQPAPENALRAVRFVTDNVAGYWASRWLLRERNVSLVVGLGGYASAATVRAAMARGIPAVLLEQNVVPGRATRWLAPSATAVCAGFAETQPYFGAKVSLRVTGNPARPAFEEMYRKLQLAPITGGWDRASGEPPELCASAGSRSLDPGHGASELTPQRRLLVIGGAGGARTLNQHMPPALAKLTKRNLLRGWQIVHQSGEGQLQETVDRYREAEVDALVVSCIDEMAAVMFESDLVVCRSIGTTLAEVALAGVPAVLVPHPRAPEGFQLANAEVFVSCGAASLIDELELNDSLTNVLATTIEPLVSDDSLRAAMADKMRRLARPDAAAEIAGTVQRILCAQSGRLAA